MSNEVLLSALVAAVTSVVVVLLLRRWLRGPQGFEGVMGAAGKPCDCCRNGCALMRATEEGQ